MKTKNKLLFIFTVIFTVMFISCASMGNYLPVSPDETVIGTVQTTFVARDSWLSKNETINTQAYIKLLEAAVRKYPGNIDVRDIIWVTGRTMGSGNIEISAMAKIIGEDTNEI